MDRYFLVPLGADKSLVGAALLLAALLGCSGAAPTGDAATAGANGDTWRRRATSCKASAIMPGPANERVMREGPLIARVAWGVDEDESRYEIACFDGPTPLDASDSAELLAIIERRIGQNPGTRVTGRQEVRVGEQPAIELRLALPEDRVGRYWIFLVDSQRLFEVSVVGPLGARLSTGEERFFGSFRVDPPPPAPAP